MRSCNLARINARTSVVATGKVCQQPVAGKVMGLPVGAAAPSSGVTVTWSGGLLTWRSAQPARQHQGVLLLLVHPAEARQHDDGLVRLPGRTQRA